MTNVDYALKLIDEFSSGDDLTQRISNLESTLSMKGPEEVKRILAGQGVSDSTIQAAFKIKKLAAQINVTIHALGILVSLPHILDPGEKIQNLSLGAGNTGKKFDLESDRRVAEFKFIQWRGGPESIRQNTLFTDLFGLVIHESTRRRCLYGVGKEEPMRFLNNRRAISSVLSKNDAIKREFYEKYGDKYARVSEYYNDVKHLVEIIDLKELVPVFGRI